MVDCQEPRAINEPATCTATVTDTDGGSKSDPDGSVDCTRSGAGTGAFSAPSCALVSDGAATFTSSCQVTYTPTGGAGEHTVTGTYNEASSALHASSAGSDDITVTQRTTSTAVDCQEPRRDQRALDLHRHRLRHRRGLQVRSGRLGRLDALGCGHGHLLGALLRARVRRRGHLHLQLPGHLHAHRRCRRAHRDRHLQRGLERAARLESGSDDITVTQRTTSTVVDCQEPRAINEPATCTATVSDTDGGSKSDPDGSVDWTRSGAGTGIFSAPSCALVYDGAATFTSSCQVTYTPTGGAGEHTVTGTYNEASSALHASSAGSDDITVTQRTTSTVVDCQEPRAINEPATCTATVSDTDGGSKSDPAGSVDWTRSGAGTGIFSAPSCALVSDGAATFTSSCQVTYTPTGGAGEHTVTGTYNEASSALHASSAGSDDITVTQRTTSTVVDCQEPRAINEPATCTATVSDTDGGSKSDPDGSVDWTRSGAGTGMFSAPSCALVSDGAATFTSSCQVTYTPTGGAGEHTVTGTYNEASSALHASSAGSDDITVTQRTTSTVVDCQEPRAINEPATCTATVSDTDGGSQVRSGRLGRLDALGCGRGHLLGALLRARVRRRGHLHLQLPGHLHAHRRCRRAHRDRHLQRGLERAARLESRVPTTSPSPSARPRPWSTARSRGRSTRPATCTATVSDTDGGSKSDPDGSVDWARSGAGSGHLLGAVLQRSSPTARPPSPPAARSPTRPPAVPASTP